MKTLKSHILKSHFAIIIMIPLSICLVLNISIKIYSSNNSKLELIEVAENVNKLFSTIGFSSRNHIDKENKERAMSDFELIRASLQASHFYNNTEFFIYNEDDTVIVSPYEDNSFLDDGIIRSAIYLLEISPENEITTFTLGLNNYHLLYKKMTTSSSYLVYISSGHYTDDFATIVNIILIIICTFFTTIALFLSNKTAEKIAKPIKELSNDVETFTSGMSININEELDCLEIINLKHSINLLSKRLYDYDIAQKSFLLNASHELRTPLMSIGGYAEGIANGIFENSKEMAGVILEESKRLDILVDKLLTLSRIENNVLNIEKINLSDIIKDYVLKMQGYAINNNININLEIQNDNFFILADDSLLAQAIINIISNCTRYAKTKIDINLFKKSNSVVILIKDDGKGFDNEQIPHIFKRFYKGEDGNLGLGLSISKTAIEYMSGSIIAYNDNGAVFEIKLDLA